MKLVSFTRTVRALAETILREHDLPADAGRVAGFVLAQHARMPDPFRLPLRILTLAFDAWSYPTSAKPFHRLPSAARSAQLARWKASRIGPRRDLVRFFESLVVFGGASEVYAPSEK